MTEKTVNEKRASTRILIGLIVGTIIGLIFNKLDLNAHPSLLWVVNNLLEPFGSMFMRSLRIIVVPLVFASLINGVGRMGTVSKLGTMGTRLAIYYFVTSLIAVVIGQILVTVVEPGSGLPMDLVNEARVEYGSKVASLMEKSTNVQSSLWPGILETIVPRNMIQAMANTNMLAIIFIAIVFGAAMLGIGKKSANPLLEVTGSIEDGVVVIVGWIMRIAPYAVAALMIGVVSKFGLELLGNLAKYALVVVGALAIHFFVTYQIFVRAVLGYPYKTFLLKMAPVIATAFSTSSSAATMPTTILTAEKSFGVKKETASFSIPLGTTVNMDGTALFECVAALFIAQIFGIEIGLGGQVSLVLLIVLSSVGVAGVPGGSIPVLMAAMTMLGIPAEGIALILGVDRLLDMLRTVLNVTGDMCGALYLAKCDNQKLKLDKVHREAALST